MQFHPGEIEVQTQTGVKELAERLCSSIFSEIKPIAQKFLQLQQLAIAASIDLNHNFRLNRYVKRLMQHLGVGDLWNILLLILAIISCTKTRTTKFYLSDRRFVCPY